MADVVLFHHALGLTEGVLRFAERLRTAGHRVNTPDLFNGQIFNSIDAGVAHAEKLGFENIIQSGVMAAESLPVRCVYAGFSLGSLPAQKLAQTRPGALGAILYHGGIPVSSFSPNWPAGVGLQMHQVEHDKWAELDASYDLSKQIAGCELFLYPGSAHLVADSSFGEYDPPSAELMICRSIAFLNQY
jgi:dienelactone hydrolase